MSQFDIEFAAVTDIGKIREKNEDNVLISSDLGLGIVADGMGGHSAGEIASNIAVSVLAETVRKIDHEQLAIPTTFLPKLALPARKLLLAANLANEAIYSTAQTSDVYKMMGTTLTGVLFEEDTATAVHVGDSRLYLLRKGKFIQITTDHSLAMEHVRRGLLTKEEANHSRIQNVLTRAMGNLTHHSSKPVLMIKNERRFRDAIMPDVVTDGTKRYEVPEKWRPANIVNSSKD